jgi:iturin family lipopeptide synthetase A
MHYQSKTPNKVHLISADVGDLAQFTDAIHWIQKQFGQITGVMHTAGIADGAMIQMLNEENVQNGLSAKVSGAMNIYLTLKDSPRSLRFFVQH